MGNLYNQSIENVNLKQLLECDKLFYHITTSTRSTEHSKLKKSISSYFGQIWDKVSLVTKSIKK